MQIGKSRVLGDFGAKNQLISNLRVTIDFRTRLKGPRGCRARRTNPKQNCEVGRDPEKKLTRASNMQNCVWKSDANKQAVIRRQGM